MKKTENSVADFLARYSIYGILPCMWFAYIAGISPWYGAAAGLALTILLALPARLVNSGRKNSESG